jgi:hypothetical protein
MWPGRRPATGWMAKRTRAALAEMRQSSLTGACARATAMP